MVTTYDSTYWLPVRPRITFKSLDGATTYFTFNAFSDSNPINVTYMDVEGAVSESGSFRINIQDSANVIDELKLRSAKVYIELGKTEATLKFFMIGFADIFTVSRPVTGYQEYQLTGFGSAIQASQLYIHKRKASKILNLESASAVGDPNFAVYKLIKDSIESKNWRPLKDKSIKDITHWTTTGISDKVNTNYPVINAPFTYLSNFLDQLCSLTVQFGLLILVLALKYLL